MVNEGLNSSCTKFASPSFVHYRVRQSISHTKMFIFIIFNNQKKMFYIIRASIYIKEPPNTITSSNCVYTN